VLAAVHELPGQWITVVRLGLERDWTWIGFADPTFAVTRTIRRIGHGAPIAADLGTVQMQHTVNPLAGASEVPQRDHSQLVFVDAFTPPLGSDGLPYQLEVRYEITASLADGSSQRFVAENTLPVTTPPAQLPRVVAAGYALGEYVKNEEYSATAARRRMLWLELAEPPRDSRDAYFVRVLAHAPDPMLLPAFEPAPDPVAYAEPAIDPELIRVVTPGQADDFAGLSAMQPLLPATGSNRHYLVPLPPNVTSESPELLGFYTYELRVGHGRGTAAAPFWSTAQGRFGPALRLEGVQHPAPSLPCHVERKADIIVASSAYAQPFYLGRNYLPDPPNTEIWFVLYAQVHQADGTSMRNLQLDARRASPRPRRRGAREDRSFLAAVPPTPSEEGVPFDRLGHAIWHREEVEAALAALALDPGTPMSVLAIELMPEPNATFRDPLGGDLGQVRILRVSPLQAVEARCC
jgi:hypothetical protein